MLTEPGAVPGAREPAAPSVRLRLDLSRPAQSWRFAAKRIEDVALGLLLLILFAPVMALVALAIRMDGPGPILFRQPRTGLHGRAFEMLKFRTMHHHLADHAAACQTARGDRRVTAVGRLLRRSSLDELPQLVNVLRGEMALVGPRPHATGMQVTGLPLDCAVPEYAQRHNVRPGLTGLAQVRGQRGAADTPELLRGRVESDLEYIRGWSLWVDAVILLRTAIVVLRMRNAW